jgi:hypothetical protein
MDKFSFIFFFLVSAVRQKYPSEDGRYVGFQDSKDSSPVMLFFQCCRPLKFKLGLGYRTLLDISDLAFPSFHVNKLNFYHFEINLFSPRHHLSSCQCQYQYIS